MTEPIQHGARSDAEQEKRKAHEQERPLDCAVSKRPASRFLH